MSNSASTPIGAVATSPFFGCSARANMGITPNEKATRTKALVALLNTLSPNTYLLVSIIGIFAIS